MPSDHQSAAAGGPQDDAVELLASPPDARDITAELAAPPRRKLPWPTLVLAGAVIATLSFAGGVWYQKDSGTSGSTRVSADRQGQGGFGGQRGGYGGQRGGNGNGGAPGGFGQNGGFTRGTVTSVQGNTVTLTDANGNTVKVTTGDSTKVTLNKEGKVTDLQPGQTITVIGQKGSDGSLTATQVTEGAAGGFGGFGGRGGGAPGGGGAALSNG
ncbi:DUF5666 domain-containing protein [Kitasatospora sp. NPDC059571]|uniref:DUF5666 domain-containing protein n=1 Tax=Kitasatospora sp. NPDC059571 TaxID=3346871 RepID=UPI00368B3A67